MKIAFFLPSLTGGGLEQVTLLFAEAIATRGFAVDVVVMNATGPLVDRIPPQVQLVDLAASRALASIPALIGYLRKQKPHVLYAAGTNANIIALAAKLLGRGKVRTIISAHTNLSNLAANPRYRREKFYPIFARYLYPHAEGIVAVSEGVKQDLLHILSLPSDRIKTIYNPIPLTTIQARAREALDHHWFASGQPPLILAVGRLEGKKDFATLLRAFKQVRQNREVHLIILGEGARRPHLEALVRELQIDDDVELPGFDPNPYRYMARADVLVLSSIHEGFGLVLVEAMACGTPVVATDCPDGPSEILNQGEYGALVPIRDPQALAHAIQDTLNSPQDSARLQARAADFSVDVAVDKLLALLLDQPD